MRAAQDALDEWRERQWHPPVPEGGWPTTLCTRLTGGADMIGAPCPTCGHTNLLHPGNANPSLAACAVCTVLGYTSETHLQGSP